MYLPVVHQSAMVAAHIPVGLTGPIRGHGGDIPCAYPLVHLERHGGGTPKCHGGVAGTHIRERLASGDDEAI